jgi:hypothetical protein
LPLERWRPSRIIQPLHPNEILLPKNDEDLSDDALEPPEQALDSSEPDDACSGEDDDVLANTDNTMGSSHGAGASSGPDSANSASRPAEFWVVVDTQVVDGVVCHYNSSGLILPKYGMPFGACTCNHRPQAAEKHARYCPRRLRGG